MKPINITSGLLLVAASASAQLLTNGIGSLPTCAQQCTILTSVATQCGSNWQCFCSRVYTQSNNSPGTVCSTSCTAAQDEALVTQWYTANCGSDNGVSEHQNARAGSTTASGSAASASASAAAAAGTASAPTGGCSSWWDCHWQWIVFVIVLAIALIVLGFGGRWLKRRHDRKKDQITGGFNSGITTRSAPMTNDKANASVGVLEPGSGRNTPSRSRDAFMPYGYGYARSESQIGPTRGGTPANEMEKGNAMAEDTPTGKRNKLRRAVGR